MGVEQPDRIPAVREADVVSEYKREEDDGMGLWRGLRVAAGPCLAFWIVVLWLIFFK